MLVVFFSEFSRPIALKLCQLIGICMYLIMQVQKLGGGATPPKKFGAKNMQNFGQFWTTSNLIANISGKARDIKNRPTLQTTAIPPAFNEKSLVKFGPLTAWNYM